MALWDRFLESTLRFAIWRPREKALKRILKTLVEAIFDLLPSFEVTVCDFVVMGVANARTAFDTKNAVKRT